MKYHHFYALFAKYKSLIIIFLIFIFALILRFYHLPDRFIFGTDEEYQANYAMTIVRDFHPIWIGVSASDTGFYLGPYWTYFTAFWLKLSEGDPLITGYVSSFIGAMTVIVLYILISKISSAKAAIISALLYASSSLIIFFDQKYWNPSTTPLLGLLIILCLTLSSQSIWYLIWAIILYGFVWHVHLSLVPIGILIIYSMYQNRRLLQFRHIISAISGYIFVILPLIIFDFVHNYSNLLTPLRLISRESSFQYSFTARIIDFATTLSRLLWIQPGSSNVSEARDICATQSLHSPLILVLAIFFTICIVSTLYKYRRSYFAWGAIIIIISYLFYPSNVSPYYLLGFFPIAIGMVGITISSITNQLVRNALLVIFIIMHIYIIFSVNENYGYNSKISIIQSAKQHIINKPYSLAWDSQCYTQEGWRYLFAQKMGIPPTSSPSDGIFNWLYSTSENRSNPQIEIKLNPDSSKFNYQLRSLSQYEK